MYMKLKIEFFFSIQYSLQEMQNYDDAVLTKMRFYLWQSTTTTVSWAKILGGQYACC